MAEALTFLKRFFANPTRIGAVAPSSRFLARALTAPLSRRSTPATVLELGAGTGAVTRVIAGLLGEADRLDICEADPALAGMLRDRLVENGPLADLHRAGHVRLFDQIIQRVEGLARYDYVISGLPLTAFALEDVRAILDIVKRVAKPGCTFSYFEYIAIRPVLERVKLGASGAAFRELSTYLTSQIRDHQVGRDSVWVNIPPAFARHWRFEGARS